MSSIGRAARIAAAVLRRPDLWLSAGALGIRLIPNQWWRRGPFPRSEYLAYRGAAVYGMPLIQIPPSEFIRYLEWCRAFPGPIR